MKKPVRIAVAGVITLGCAAMALLAASQMTMTYYLPPLEPGGEASEHTAAFGPAVVAFVITVLLTVVAGSWLIWNLVRRPPAKLWALAALVLLAAVVAALMAQQLPRPSF